MYQPNHAPPSGCPRSRDPPGRPGGLTGATSGLSPAASPRPSPSPTDGHFRHNKPLFVKPQRSSVPVDYCSMIGLGRTYQRLPHWTSSPAQCPLPDSSDRASEELLRCAAGNKPLPNYPGSGVEDDLANVAKEASVRADPGLRKLLTRPGQSSGRGRGGSGSGSRARSRSRSRSGSRGRSKSRARAKSALRGRRRSRSWSQTQTRSRGQRSSSSSSSSSSSGGGSSSGSEKAQEKEEQRRRRGQKSGGGLDKDENPTGGGLLTGLRVVVGSRGLEDGSSGLKGALLGIQASSQSKTDQLFRGQQRSFQENPATGEEPMVLPHDRVGSNFSWLQAGQRAQKEAAVEAEDSLLRRKASQVFLCGEDRGGAQEAPPRRLQSASRTASAPLDSGRKTRSVLPCLGSAEAPEPLSTGAVQEGSARREGDASSQIPAGTHKTEDGEQRSRLKRAATSKMELLMKELQRLTDQNGFDFLTPVVGFYCQKCEEFFGDWTSAEEHAALHCSSEVRPDGCAAGGERHARRFRAGARPRPSPREGHGDSSCHSSAGELLADGERGEERPRGGGGGAAGGRERLFLEEEMRKERMLITVCQGPEPPSRLRLHQEPPSPPGGRGAKSKSQKKKKKKKKDGKRKKRDKS